MTGYFSPVLLATLIIALTLWNSLLEEIYRTLSKPRYEQLGEMVLFQKAFLSKDYGLILCVLANSHYTPGSQYNLLCCEMAVRVGSQIYSLLWNWEPRNFFFNDSSLNGSLKIFILEVNSLKQVLLSVEYHYSFSVGTLTHSNPTSCVLFTVLWNIQNNHFSFLVITVQCTASSCS